MTKEEKQYLNKEFCDCPWCGYDRPDHSCDNCYSSMTREECWKWEGHCCERCFKYIKEELPAIRQKKIDMGIKCLCDEPQCAKCLAGNCQYDNCLVHTSQTKNRYRKIKITYI